MDSNAKAKRIIDWIVIGSFIAIVALVASIQIHHSVVNSDWYVVKQWRKSFEKMSVKVNDTDSIECIEVEFDDNTEDYTYIYDVPAELFDDIKIISYERVDDFEKLHKLWRGAPCIVVFFNDNSVALFLTTVVSFDKERVRK